eukprot:UN00902
MKECNGLYNPDIDSMGGYVWSKRTPFYFVGRILKRIKELLATLLMKIPWKDQFPRYYAQGAFESTDILSGKDVTWTCKDKSLAPAPIVVSLDFILKRNSDTIKQFQKL